MKNQFLWENSADRSQLMDVVQQNEIFIGSTDTVLGLMGAATAEVKQKIDNMKQRRGKPYLILVDSFEQVLSLAEIENEQIRRFLDVLWPAPVTVILPKKHDAPEYIGSTDTIAIRMPDHAGLRELCGKLAYGLFSTSANISGEPVPQTLHEVDQKIMQSVCCYINGAKNADTSASTIIDMTQKMPQLIRQGSVSMDQIKKLFDEAGSY